MNAPIALFVYNRPDHVRQTVSALLTNEEARDSDLYIFSDGSRDQSNTRAVFDVREYIKTIIGFNSLTIIERETNWGLAQSIIDGVTQLTEKYGTVIVLEDDIVTSPYFLKYMNDALRQYRDVQTVMHISGCNYPIGELSLVDQQTYLLRVPLCWGWATWAPEWHLFQRDLMIMKKFTRRMIRDLNFDDTYGYWCQMEANRNGKITTWFIFWYATLYLNKGLALFPKTSLVNNIGHDGSGVHCGPTDNYNTQLSMSPIEVRSIPLVESKIAFEAHKTYFRSIRTSLLRRIFRKLQKITR